MSHQLKPKRKQAARPVAKKTPAYAADDGPLTAKQIAAIKKHAPRRLRKVRSSLFRLRAGEELQ